MEINQITQNINIKVNGKSVNCSLGITLPDLLTEMKFNLRLVVVEYNGEILHRQFWENTTIKKGDSLEVVTIVGGG